jgi:hypothetical protein
MPENTSIVAFCIFLNKLSAVVLQGSENLPAPYPVWFPDKILNVSGMGLEGGLEGLCLVGLDMIGPEFNG